MAFKMKAGSEGPFRKNFGIGASPLKNYKKGYYGEGSSFKSNGDDDPHDENRRRYGTSSRYLKNESYQTRVEYKKWKSKQERNSDKSFNAFKNRNNKKKKKKKKVKRNDYGSLRHLNTVNL